MENFNVNELDLYEILEIDLESSIAEIKKAYRKKALQLHPDKNPDDPHAGKKFHQLTKILELLTDESARKAYDRVLTGRKEAQLRNKELCSKRRKLKEELEFREKQLYTCKTEKNIADENLRKEIERLQKEGSRQVEEEVQYVIQQIQKEKNDKNSYTLKIKWKARKGDKTNGGYTEEMLWTFFSKYGEIQAIIVSTKRSGSALIEFKDKSAASMAVDLEAGLQSNPLEVKWIQEPPKPSTSSLVKDSDFESITLTKLKQAEERKKLIEQMMKEEQEKI